MIAPALEAEDLDLRVVSEINGRYDCHYDELCQDRAGRWYYRRTIQQQTCHEDDPHFDSDGKRVLLHRLSLEGAILWELGISGHGPLRDAAWDRLKAGPRQPATPVWTVPLTPGAERELRSFCERHNLRPEYVLQDFCECWLDGDALRDRLNAGGTVENARRRERLAKAKARRQRKGAA